MAKKEDGWQEVESTQAEIWRPGEKPGAQLIGTLRSAREVETDNGKRIVYEIHTSDGPRAVFTAPGSQLARKLGAVLEFPGPGAEVRVRFVRWYQTKHGGRGREYSVAFRAGSLSAD